MNYDIRNFAKMTASNIMTEIVDKVAFSNYLPLMTRATADDSEPTPGYMLEEIETYLTAPHCNRLVGYLLQRLGRQSNNVKLKVLKIMLHLVKRGHANFRVILRRNDGHIKMSTVNRSTSDPFIGSKSYDAIVQAAQTLLQVLFDPELLRKDDEGVAEWQQTKVNLGSLGSQGLPQGKYEGFGNSPVEKETLKGKVMDYFEKLLNPSEDLNSDIKSILYSSPGLYRPPVFEDDIELQQSSVKDAMQKEMKAHVPGKAGGGWETDDEEELKISKTMQLKNLHSSTITSSSESIERLDFLSTKENLAEVKFIESFCESNTLPLTTLELDRAMKQCIKLDGIKILQSLFHTLISYAQKIAEKGLENDDMKEPPLHEKSVSKYLMLALLLLEWFVQVGKVAPEISSAIMKPALLTLLESTSHLNDIHAKARKLKLILERKK